MVGVATSNSPSTSVPRPPGGLVRLLLVSRLALLSTERAARDRRFRSLRLGGVLLAISAVTAVGLAVFVGAGDVSDLVALRLLAYAAWMYGLVGLPALLHPQLAEESGHSLARLRGLSPRLPSVRTFGLALRLGGGLLLAALPGIVVSALTSATLSSLTNRLALVASSVAYLMALAATLAAVGALAERAWPSRPRTFAVAVLLGPFVLGFWVDEIPSIPSAFIWAFEGLVSWGGLR